MKQSILFFQRISLLLSVLLLLAGCSGSDSEEQEKGGGSQPEIRFNADVWQVMSGTRATTFDNATALQKEANFTCTVYDANTITEHYPATQVDWSTDHWEFHNVTYRWPSSGSLDFFAYMPATQPSYITNIAYITARSPQITCTGLPMTSEGQGSSLKEFVYALTIEQNKEGQGESGVTMKFYHPFARINLQLAASHPNVTINSITLKGLKSGGTCTFSNTSETSMFNTSTWSSWTPSDGTVNFVLSLTGDAAVFNTNVAAQPIGDTFIMVPQTFAGNIEVNASWTDWGESIAHTVSTSIPSLTWAPGTSYTYTFTITETDLKVDTEKFTEQW